MKSLSIIHVSCWFPSRFPDWGLRRGGGRKKNQKEPDAQGIDYSCMILKINKVFGKFLKHIEMLGSSL